MRMRKWGNKHLKSNIAEAVFLIRLFLEHNWSKVCPDGMNISFAKILYGGCFMIQRKKIRYSVTILIL